jgi:hypothetical protein
MTLIKYSSFERRYQLNFNSHRHSTKIHQQNSHVSKPNKKKFL